METSRERVSTVYYMHETGSNDRNAMAKRTHTRTHISRRAGEITGPEYPLNSIAFRLATST